MQQLTIYFTSVYIYNMIYFNQALSQLTYNDGYIRGDHPTNPGTEGADSHCWVPDHGGEKFGRKQVDGGEGRGGANLTQDGQTHHRPVDTYEHSSTLLKWIVC